MDLSDFSLEGKLAVVTGGNRGLGQGMAIALAKAGADIVSVQRSGESPETLALVEALGRRCYAVACDLAELQTGEDLAANIEDQFGPVDILVNNAGIQRRHPAEQFPLEEWDLVMQVQLRSVFMLCQAFGKRMLERGSGKIINIASLLSFSGGLTVPAYAAAKGGVAQLTKALANEWSSRGVNVNAIAPGYMATEMNTALIGDSVRSGQIMDRIPAKRWGSPEDMGGTAVFLASEAARYIHGQIICVDGGWMAR
ncbi:2-deoxy-D-gluconate 3-dehydrogenase [Paenibacillus sophorae]|uniref:2-dehydro-3-deoxy-D-gluconate 5-dehydrogenase KduD n=1 Tax=Paenibacillus sophorae TaxID=1333845 RepID=A0A1H8ULS2_9BACL|nr:2-dehydro-3-deoxy-D-gluconate 5-dehydrogenase KduD [Paenibacillus sophorae]QWU13302.1 2-dehydro-3-deoxy-D-gluconate 5-dehydrogenase KduD [Paenibacillus sophorae]SEP04175.1 2-deoxy-D-gluconate 3-dehydrogenase [Paenibacillus sophorae]